MKIIKLTYSYILFIILIVATLSTTALGQMPIKIFAEELPPYNFLKNDMVYGISTEILIRVMENSGNPIDRSLIKIVPWARGYRTVQIEPGSMLFSAARTEQREKLFQWVGPIMPLTIGLIALKEKHIKIDSVEDLKKYRIGTIRDGAPEQLVIKAGVDENKLNRIASPTSNIKKLNYDRIDLFAFNVPTTMYLILTMGLNPEDYEVVHTLKKADLYYVFHKDTDKKFINDLNQVLKELKKADQNGKSEYDRILEFYLGSSNK